MFQKLKKSVCMFLVMVLTVGIVPVVTRAESDSMGLDIESNEPIFYSGVGVVDVETTTPSALSIMPLADLTLIDEGTWNNAANGAPWRLYEGGIVYVGEGHINQPTSWGSAWGAYSNIVETVTFTGPVTTGTSLAGLFAGNTALTTINGLQYIDTTGVVNMSGMFSNTPSLVTVDMSGWNTSSVDRLNQMFENSGVVSAYFTGWNTENLRNMTSMFRLASRLTNLDISHFDTSQVYAMDRTFSHMWGLQHLDISDWDTSEVIHMQLMFYDAVNLQTLDLTGWDTGNVASMNDMFRNTGLRSLDISGFDTIGVTNMNNMFTDTIHLRQLTLGRYTLLGAGFPGVPDNDIYWGRWINVGDGSIYIPFGDHAFTPAQFSDVTNGDILADTWVWQRRVNPTMAFNIGQQVTPIVGGTVGTISFPVTVDYIVDGLYFPTTVIDGPDSIFLNVVPQSLIINNGTGTLTVNMPNTVPAGTHEMPIRINVIGSYIDATVNIIVSRFIPTLQLSIDPPDSVLQMNTVTLTATLSGAYPNNSNRPIVFYVNDEVRANGITDAQGVAVVTIPATPIGEIDFRASFVADVDNAAVSATINGFEVLQREQAPLNIVSLSPTYTYGVGEVILITTGGTIGDVTFISSNPEIASVNSDDAVLTIHQAGSFTVTATRAGNDLYPPRDSAPFAVTVNQYTPNVSLDITRVPGSTAMVLTATVSTSQTGMTVPTGSVQFFHGDVLLDTMPLVGGVATLTLLAPPFPLNIITYRAEFSGMDGFYYPQQVTETFDSTLQDQDAITIVVPSPIIFGTDTSIPLTILGGSGAGSTTFDIPENNGVLAPSDINDFTFEVIGAGVVTITARRVSYENYNPVTSQPTIIEVLPREVYSNIAATINENNFIFTGNQIQPTLTVSDYDLGDLTSEDFTLEFGENINVVDGGSVTVIGRRNYTGSQTITFAIEPRDITNAEITLSTSIFSFTGAEIVPNIVSVMVDDINFPSDVFTVTLTDNIQVGSATLQIEDTQYGNFTGTANVPFTITNASGAQVSNAPTLASSTLTSITINPVNVVGNTGQTVEFAISNNQNIVPTEGWQTGLTFSGLTTGSTYFVFARAAASNNYSAGSPQVSEGFTLYDPSVLFLRAVAAVEYALNNFRATFRTTENDIVNLVNSMLVGEFENITLVVYDLNLSNGRIVGTIRLEYMQEYDYIEVDITIPATPPVTDYPSPNPPALPPEQYNDPTNNDDSDDDDDDDSDDDSDGDDSYGGYGLQNNEFRTWHNLDNITDAESAANEVENIINTLTHDERNSGIIELIAEMAIRAAAFSNVSVEGDLIVINQSNVEQIQHNANETHAAILEMFERIGHEASRELRNSVSFIVIDREDVSIRIEPSALQLENIEYVWIRTPYYDLAFSMSFMQSNVDVPLYVTVTSSANSARVYNVDFSHPVTESVRLGVSPIEGDTEYQVLISTDGTNAGGRLNPVTGNIEARVNTSGQYTVVNNRVDFADIQNRSQEMQTAIRTLASREIINGMSDTEFRPDETISRAQVAALLARMLGIYDPNADGGFIDVVRLDWFFGTVGTINRHGIMRGLSETHFMPNQNIPRDQLATLSARVLQREMHYRIPTNVASYLQDFNDFADIADWSRPYIALITREDLIPLRADGNFLPNSTMTRGEVAIMIHRLYLRLW